jgi:hypothetical protein
MVPAPFSNIRQLFQAPNTESCAVAATSKRACRATAPPLGSVFTLSPRCMHIYSVIKICACSPLNFDGSAASVSGCLTTTRGSGYIVPKCLRAEKGLGVVPNVLLLASKLCYRRGPRFGAFYIKHGECALQRLHQSALRSSRPWPPQPQKQCQKHHHRPPSASCLAFLSERGGRERHARPCGEH